MKFSVVMTGVGIFSLAGIVVRSSILLIEFIDELRRGLSVIDAVVEGGATRITPSYSNCNFSNSGFDTSCNWS
ncbi:MAG: hypothetical protein U0T81_01325 [Saprospiraceae bacterium]